MDRSNIEINQIETKSLTMWVLQALGLVQGSVRPGVKTRVGLAVDGVGAAPATGGSH